MFRTILVVGTLFSSIAFAQSDKQCSDEFSKLNLVELIITGENPLKKALTNIKECVSQDKALREQLDFAAIEGLMMIDRGEIDQSYKPMYVLGNVMTVLEYTANLGSISAQHNLASIYNSNPDTQVRKLIGRDVSKFVYWTRMAASNGDPRSIFNLAVRMANDETGESGVPLDRELAFKLFATIILMKDKYQLDYLMPMIRKELEKLKLVIKKERATTLFGELKEFDLKVLAPKA